MFEVRNNGNSIEFCSIAKRIVFAKTKDYGSIFNRFEDYTITLKDSNISISIWSNCRALRTLLEKQYKNDIFALARHFKDYKCMVCIDQHSSFQATMIFVAPRRIVFLYDDGSTQTFRLKDGKNYFELPVTSDANI